MKHLLLTLALSAATLWASASPGAQAKNYRADTSTPAGAVRSVRLPQPMRGGDNSLIPRLHKQGTRLSALRHFPGQRRAQAEADAAPLVFAGSVTYYEGLFDDTPKGQGVGVYQFTEGDEALTLVYPSNTLNAEQGGISYGNKLFCAYQQELLGGSMNVGRVWDRTAWTQDFSTSDLGYDMFSTAMVRDPETGTFYGCFCTASGLGYEFGTADMEHLTRTSKIADVVKPWVAMYFCSGRLYGVDAESNLYSINKENGVADVVGYLALDLTYRSGFFTDEKTGRYFIEVCNDYENAMYELLLTDPVPYAEYICDVPEQAQIFAMYASAPAAADAAPAAPTGLETEFDGPDLFGAIAFTAPATTFRGDPLTGTLSYKVLGNGEQLATGTVEPGARAVAQFTVPISGEYVLDVICSNAAGDGAKATLKQWVGYDKPRQAYNVRITRSGTVNTITWDPVTRGAGGGYFIPEDVTYRVKRLPDNVIVASGLTDCVATDDLPAPDDFVMYTYNVIASHHGVDSAEAESDNSVPLGAVTLPYSNTFDDWNRFAELYVDNVGADNRYWKWNRTGAVYITNSDDADMDDWLITPGLRLEGGRSYHYSFAYKCEYPDCPETIEVYLGQTQSSTGMTTPLLQEFVITNTDYQTYDGVITAPDTGTYYLGIRCATPKGVGFYTYIDNLKIESGVTDASPAECAATFTPDPDGATKVTVDVTAPTLNVAGEPLTDLDRVEVARDGELVKSFPSPAPGQSLSFVDEADSKGYKNYLITAYNTAGGAGKAIARSVYFGINYAAGPATVTLTEEGNTGNLHLTWSASDRDIDGFALNPALVSYGVYDNNIELMGRTSECQYDVATTADPQHFVNYLIVPRTERGDNLDTPGASEMVPVGTPYALPYNEELAYGKLSYRYAQDGACYWSVCQLSPVEAVLECDADAAGDTGSLLTGKIDIASAADPYITFSLWMNEPNDNTLTVQAIDLATGAKADVKAFPLSEGTGWVRCRASLADYKGKTVQLGLKVTANNTKYPTYVNRLTVADTPASDMAVTQMAAPSVANIGTDMEFTVVYSNEGTAPASGYSVALLCGDEEIASLEGETLQPLEEAQYTFRVPATALFDVASRFYARVNFASDANDDNNRTDEATVRIPHSNGGIPSGLAASEDPDGSVLLSWEAPVQDGTKPDEVCETFENYEPFEVNKAGSWSFIDGDGLTVYTPNQTPFPNSNQPLAYMVFDNSYDASFAPWDAHSGTKYLATFCAYQGVNDDWAISPQLSGEAQTIGLWARSLSTQYGAESFEFCISDAGPVVEDFTVLAQAGNVPAVWNYYEIAVPAGTQYFAIHCNSADKLMFMVDDVTFTPLQAQERVLLGYNVYRDRELATASPVAEPSYRDRLGATGTHSYRVTAVYDSGESMPSDAVSAASSVSVLTGTQGQAQYYDLQGRCVAAPASGIYIRVLDGRATKLRIP